MSEIQIKDKVIVVSDNCSENDNNRLKHIGCVGVVKNISYVNNEVYLVTVDFGDGHTLLYNAKEVELLNKTPKEKLKNGMIVQNEEGHFYIYIDVPWDTGGVLFRHNEFNYLRYYDDNLSNTSSSNDIIAIYEPKPNNGYAYKFIVTPKILETEGRLESLLNDDCNLIWKREEKKFKPITVCGIRFENGFNNTKTYLFEAPYNSVFAKDTPVVVEANGEKQNAIVKWCESIGSQEELDTLLKERNLTPTFPLKRVLEVRLKLEYENE